MTGHQMSPAYADFVATLPRAPEASPTPVAVVTGANTGLGLESVRALAMVGYDVVLACRSKDRALAAIAGLKKDLGPLLTTELLFLQLDLLDHSGSCTTFSDRLRPLLQSRAVAILLNNAGVMAPANRDVCAKGIDVQFSANHLGHFVLVAGLLPLMDDDCGRIVHVASLAAIVTPHQRAADPWRAPVVMDPNQWWVTHKWELYNIAKHANLAFGKELAVRLQRAGRRVQSVVAHPGMTATELLRGMGPMCAWMARPWSQAADVGAIPQIQACLGTGVASGEVLAPNGPGWCYELWGSSYKTGGLLEEAHVAWPDAGAQLWAKSEQLTGVTLVI